MADTAIVFVHIQYSYRDQKMSHSAVRVCYSKAHIQCPEESKLVGMLEQQWGEQRITLASHSNAMQCYKTSEGGVQAQAEGQTKYD